ncbi:targeting protein for Xklp2 homolog isoform X2 [Aethina tumida]|uniref:targeting protein for Xklp2 homolog isoform X2 n=1 Tax=Aethina tumida TaxID=116153 RepID=UPI00096B23E4|nr:targeting protein for Xklp2 homolog isoform X2 [Aethina tumida]
MSEDFAFDAPQFCDFNKSVSDEKLESYFAVDHENYNPGQQGMYEDISYEAEDISHTADETEDFYTPPQSAIRRRSKSAGPSSRRHNVVNPSGDDVHTLTNDLVHLGITKSKTLVKYSSSDNLSQFPIQKSKLARASSRDNINRLAQPRRAFSSTQEVGKNNEYVSTAQLLAQWQRKTPIRFRSNQANQPTTTTRLTITKPQSPALRTKARYRPTTVMSTEEREQKELEEIHKFKIKAHPVNKRILQGPLKAQGPMEKKPLTVPQPFNLTAVPKKVQELPTAPTPAFHAKPVPNNLRSAPKLPQVPQKKITQPITPKFMKTLKKSQSLELPPPDTCQKQELPLTRTKPIPFSFEKRDLQIQKKKEERIKQVLEEEKKMREFHANPRPKYLASRNSSCNSSLKSANSSHKSNETLCEQFKARPATVLYKEPFMPKYGEKPLTEIAEFHLSCEQRMQERKQFDLEQKEREDKLRAIKEEEEKAKKIKEEEEREMFRKQTEIKAQPIRKYKPIVIQPSNKVTVPVSPEFMSRKTMHVHSEDKENISSNY